MLRFYGVPILAAPMLTFPLNDERKSGFLPPSVGLDSRSGLQAAVPYYWNIAPNRDATFTLHESLRRGPALDSEFRYLEPDYFGEVNFKLHAARRGSPAARAMRCAATTRARCRTTATRSCACMRVSDDDYWKDFPGELKTPTPRLLPTELQLTRPFGDWIDLRARPALAGAADRSTRRPGSTAPYERLPQVGARSRRLARRLRGRPSRPSSTASPTPTTPISPRARPACGCTRSAARPAVLLARLDADAEGLVQRRDLFARPAARRRAAQRLARDPDASASTAPGPSSARRTCSAATCGRRSSRACSTSTRRTGARTTCRTSTPAPKDFNFDSIFTENAFSGVDRVSDSNQLTAGVTTRVLDPRHRRRGAAARHGPALPVSATSASRPTACR